MEWGGRRNKEWSPFNGQWIKIKIRPPLTPTHTPTIQISPFAFPRSKSMCIGSRRGEIRGELGKYSRKDTS